MEIGKLYRYRRYIWRIAMIVDIQPYMGKLNPQVIWHPLGGETTSDELDPYFEVTWLYGENTTIQLFTEESFLKSYVRIG